MAKKKLNVFRILGVGILYALVALIVHYVGAWIGMGHYYNPDYFQVWSRFMMPAAGPPPANFYFMSFMFGVLGGILFTLVYHVIKDAIPVKNVDEKGILYGLIVFIVSGIPSTLSTYLLINLPLPLITLWAVENWVICLIGGIIAAQAIK